jgi:RNA polymerase sigma factor FliA
VAQWLLHWGSEKEPSVQTVAPPTPPAEVRQYERELLEQFTPVVHKLASAFQRRLPCNVLRDDLIAAGMGGLWDAIQKHGHEESGNFEWYVRVRVRGAILDELRAQDWLPRRARAAANRTDRQAPQHATPYVVRFDDVSDYE